jgi:hypothetical protein
MKTTKEEIESLPRKDVGSRMRAGEVINRKRVQRLMRVMGLGAIYPEPWMNAAGKGHRIYRYLPHPGSGLGTSGPRGLDERAAKGRRILV